MKIIVITGRVKPNFEALNKESPRISKQNLGFLMSFFSFYETLSVISTYFHIPVPPPPPLKQ